MLARLAAACFRHPRFVVLAWTVVLVGGLVMAPALFGRLTSEVASIDGSESQRTARAVGAAAPAGDEIFAIADGRRADDPGLRASVERVAAALSTSPGVADVRTPWTDAGPDGTPEPRAVSRDGRAVGLVVRFAPSADGERAIDRSARLLRTIDAPRVVVGGGRLLDDEMQAQAAADLARAELLSMPVVLVLLLVVFGGIIAAGLPVIVAGVGVAATLGALALASLVTDVSVYAVNIVTMLGLGLAIDYALLLVSRFREERAADADVQRSLERTLCSAGRTVMFSGLTVAASLGGLLAFPDDFLRSMGVAGLAVVLLVMVAALTLLPAMLAMVGRRVRPAWPQSGERGVFVTVARLVRRRPVLVIASTTVVLVLAAAPFLNARYADPDGRSLPASTQGRQLADLVQTRFDTRDDVDPVTVVVRDTPASDALSSYVESLRSLDGVRRLAIRSDVPGLTVIDLTPVGQSQGPVALRLVRDVRGMEAPAPVAVAGSAAELVDYEDALASRLPLAVSLVASAAFVLLFLFTGSVVIPLKALVMNTLSLGASFGALVWVFQEGHLGGVVGTEALGSLSITTPVLVFAVAFGLSMDYEVFLLGRICEAWRRTGDNDLAVAEGLQRTGRIVTAAAFVMATIFAGFVAGGFSPVKQVGLGLLLAVLVDATLVRLLLMPAVMNVMGRANWWAPRPLRRLHRRIGLGDPLVVPEPEPRR